MLPQTIKRLFGLPAGDRGQGAAPEGGGVFLHGEGDYSHDVNEVSGQQRELYEFFAGIAGEADAQHCLATLGFNRTDRSPGERVSVAIDGRVVGSCPSWLGNQIREWLEEWNYAGADVLCRGLVIHRRGIRSSQADRFVLKLDIAIPFKMTTF